MKISVFFGRCSVVKSRVAQACFELGCMIGKAKLDMSSRRCVPGISKRVINNREIRGSVKKKKAVPRRLGLYSWAEAHQQTDQANSFNH